MIFFPNNLNIKDAIYITCFLVCLSGCSTPPDKSTEYDKRGLYAAELSDDGDLAIISSVDKSAELWDYHKAKRLYIWQHNSNLEGDLAHVNISNNSKIAISASNKNIAVWDTKSGKSIGFWKLDDFITNIKLSETGQYALISYATKKIHILDLLKGYTVFEANHSAYIETVDLSFDNSFAVVGCDDNTVTVWDIKKNERKHLLRTKTKPRFVKISPNNKYIVISTPFRPVDLYDLQSGKLEHELTQTPKYLSVLSRPIIHISSARFSDNEEYLLAGAPPRNLYIWDLKDGRLIDKITIAKKEVWKPTSAIVYATAFSENNKYVYAIASNGNGYTWSLDY